MNPSYRDLVEKSPGFDFSFRPDYGTRLFVFVPQESLDVLRDPSEPTEGTLSIIVRYDGATRTLAIVKSRRERTDRVTVTTADAESIRSAFC